MAQTMIVTQALDELKLLEARINRAIREAVFVTVEVGTKREVDPSFGTVGDFNTLAQSNFDRIKGLIDRWNKIKSAIVLSNAGIKTNERYELVTINVGDQKMTVAEALERKGNSQKGKAGSLQFYKQWLTKMEENHANVVNKLVIANARLDNQVDAWIESSFGKDVSRKNASEDQQTTIDAYISSRKSKMLDPLGINKEIDKLREFVEDFESNIKTSLQVANARMEITIED